MGGGERSKLSLFGSAGFAGLHLNEPCAHTFLGKGALDDKIDSWYLDTGATHHMTGWREFFFDLDSSVKGSVKLGHLQGQDRGAPSSHLGVLYLSLEELHHQHRTARQE
jgi:hypothetical protein